jgi:8-oxo-dGTP pyrophosphatase MutT (NUDIX family)
MPTRPWPAIELARRQLRPRVPFFIDQACVGSVDAGHLDALLAWPGLLQVGRDGVRLRVAPPDRDAALATINAGLRGQGLVLAWRDETYPVTDPTSGRLLARTERAASRFWGTLTFGAHANGWVAGADGRPAALWIAQRSFDKATDPGAHDNLVGGGVPLGQSPLQTLVREGFEEAGLPADVMQRARPGRVIELRRDIPEGLQFERIHAFDLSLQPDEVPVNQDGEVHAFTMHPLPQALAIASGTTMTADAALVTLDFALRHRLLPADMHDDLAARAAGLWVGP